MKLVRFCFMLLCISMLCCGCQKTPDEVKERMKTYGENEQLASDEIEYCTVEELKKSNLTDMDIKLDNMTLPAKVDFSHITIVEELTMAFDNDYTESGKKFLDIFHINKETLVDEEKAYGGKSVTYDSQTEKTYFAMEDNGFMSYLSGITYDLLNSDLQQSIIRKYDLYEDTISEETVSLGAENVTLTELCDDAENWLKQYLSTGDCNYKVSDIYVRQLKTDDKEQNQVSMFAEMNYKGIPFNAYGMESEFDGTVGKTTLMMYGINLNYEKKGELSYFSNSVGELDIKSSKKVDKVVNLKSAIKIVNEELSAFHKRTISKIIPIYALYPQYNPDNPDEGFSDVNQVVEARPVYAFIIDEGKDDSALGIVKPNACKFVFVDMIDGKITTNIE